MKHMHKPEPPAVLDAPTLDAVGGDDYVTLTWGEVTNADSYNLIVWDEATSDWLPNWRRIDGHVV